MDSVLDYPTWYQTVSAFSSTSGSISALAAVHDQMLSAVKDVSLLGSFLDNHDRAQAIALSA